MSSLNKMETMPVSKLIISMSLPIMISMLIQALYNIVDSMFVAQYAKEALAAVSLAFPIQSLLIAVAVGTSAGLNALLSRKLGEKRFEEANDVARHGLLAGALSAIPFFIFGFCFSRMFISAFSSVPSIIDAGSTYLMICCSGSLFVLIEIMYERIFQASGHAMYNMYMQGTGALINIILDPIFIFGLFGIPEMGVMGAALATVIGQFLAVLLGMYLHQKHVKEVHISFQNFHVQSYIFYEMYAVGFPAILMQSIVTIMTIGMNAILVGFGETAVSVFSVYFKLQSFVFMAVFGMNNALVAILAYNYGANAYKRIIEAMRFSIVACIVIMGIGTGIFQFFPDLLLALFDADQDMLTIGIPALRIISLSFVFAGISIELCAFFQAMGKGLESLLVSLCRQLLLVLPLAYLFGKINIDMIWYAFVIAEIISLLVAVILYLKTKKNFLQL